jgi:hypothetical protein
LALRRDARNQSVESVEMTIEELEAACDRSESPDFSRHLLDVPELWLRETYYPLGFPMELRTNSAAILSHANQLWSMFDQRFDTRPIRVDVHVEECDRFECPPETVCRIMPPLLVNMADPYNFSVANIEHVVTQMTITRAAERHSSYLGYFFLGCAPLVHLATSYATPVHAACIALGGRGMLLCGDSGAGKSSLAFACARAGWTYVTDDSSYLINGGAGRQVTGNYHQIRFRPSGAELFPELTGLEITPRAAGKPSIELLTANLRGIACAQTAEVEFLVFLNRRVQGPPELVTYRKDVARCFLRQGLFGLPESRAMQYDAIERLLSAQVLELRYSDLGWAVERLAKLAGEGS